MSITPIEFKRRFLHSIFERGEWIRQVNDIQYVTRCPYCGDSQSNYNTGHFYFRCSLEDNYPVVYNCFKCQASGVLTRKTLEKLGIKDIMLISSLGSVNKKFSNVRGLSYKAGESFKQFPYILPENRRHREKIEYVEKRLEISFTEEMIQNTKIITSLKEFLVLNQYGKITCEPYIAQKLEDNYIGFLSYGNSHILFRDVTEREKISWVKYPISPASLQNNVCYSLKAEVDIFTEDIITINLCEGVMDIISICYNLGYNKENCINMCVCGKSYRPIVNRLISQGFVGYNVILNVFSDNDKDFNRKKGNEDTTIKFYRNAFRDYVLLFKEVNIFYNTMSKDCGVPKYKIRLKKYRL